MKRTTEDYITIGYIILLVVIGSEARVGLELSIIQIILALLIFIPKIIGWAFSNLFDLILKSAFVLSLILGIYLHWFDLPNHYFLFLAITLVLFLFNKSEEFSRIKLNLRWIIIILMGFATLHKLINPIFIDGDFIGLKFLKGGLFLPIFKLGIFSELRQVFLINLTNILELNSIDPALGKSIFLKPNHLTTNYFVLGFSYLIVILEFLLALIFLLIPNRKITALSFWLFVSSIGFIVLEFEFASLLLFVGFVLFSNSFAKLKKLYLLSFLFYALAAISYNIYLFVG